MKPVIVFTIADQRNEPYAEMMLTSLKKFHPDWDTHVVKGEELAAYLKDDPAFFYRATPIVAQAFIKDYELVIKIDADSIITGSLDYVLNTKDYDVGTVINWNRVDPEKYGYVQAQGILPAEYMNCGFVAMRSEAFVKDWKGLCFSKQFDRLQYKEQDLLNLIIYYGNYNVRCFDLGDNVANHHAWYGLIAKGEWSKVILKDGKLIIPRGEDNFPPRDTELKVLHWAGGNDEKKLEYKTRFNEEVVTYLDKLVK